MQRCGANAIAALLIAVSMSQLSDAKSWREVNTTCPALRSCQCKLVRNGADVACHEKACKDQGLTADMERLNLTIVRTLIISFCDTKVVPSSWFANHSIFTIYIQHSSFNEIHPDAFVGMSKLRKLWLERNKFETIPGALRSLHLVKNLHIRGHPIRNVTDELHSLGNLKELSLRSNLIELIQEDAFHNLTELSKLYLQDNQIYYLPPRLFENNRGLNVIDLHNNRIKVIGEVFNSIPDLKSLFLYNNAIQDIDNFARRDFSNLEVLRADNTLISHITEFDYQENFSLKTLLFRNCSISKIHPRAFQKLASMTRLDVSMNHIAYIDETAFHPRSLLEYFTASENDIVSLSGTLKRMRKLLHLNASYNRIEDIGGAFAELARIKKLSLRKNRIAFIRDGTFTNNTSLQYLDLNENKIAWLDKGAFRGLVNLKLLLLGENLLLRLNGSVTRMPNLEILNLEYNKLAALESDDFVGDHNLKYVYAYENKIQYIKKSFRNTAKLSSLNLRGNRLRTLSRTSFPSSMTMLTLFIEDNDVICDCRVGWILGSAVNKTSRRSPICADPPWLRSSVLYSLTTAALRSWPESCDEKCTCNCHEDAEGEREIHVACTNKSLRQIPGMFPESTRKLDLSGNHLEYIGEALVKKTPNLHSLFLSDNLLSHVNSDMLPEKTEVLDLRRNKLTRFPFGIVTKHNLTSIWLNGNPWKCDCEDYAFRQWAEVNGKIMQDEGEITCARGPNPLVSLKPFMNLTQNNLCISAVSKWLLYGLPLLILAAVVLTLSTLYLKYKRELKVWLYARGICSSLQCVKEDDLDEEKLFDMFLSFSSKDSAWAYTHLIPWVENHGFTVCTYDRNFKGGFLLQDIIQEAVSSSRRTLLLLTQNFLESEWCRWEFRVAHQIALAENFNRLIVVLVEPLATEMIDGELRIYLQTTNYLRWGEPHFWDKLTYSLPRQDVKRKLIPSSQDLPMTPVRTTSHK